MILHFAQVCIITISSMPQLRKAEYYIRGLPASCPGPCGHRGYPSHQDPRLSNFFQSSQCASDRSTYIPATTPSTEPSNTVRALDRMDNVPTVSCGGPSPTKAPRIAPPLDGAPGETVGSVISTATLSTTASGAATAVPIGSTKEARCSDKKGVAITVASTVSPRPAAIIDRKDKPLRRTWPTRWIEALLP